MALTHPAAPARPHRLGLPSRDDFRRLFALALPVIFIQVGTMTISVAQNVMLGHVSAADLAAGALGNFYLMSAGAIGWGILMALDPIVSQAAGARDETALRHGIQRGLLLAGIVSALTVLLLLPARALFEATRQPAEVIPMAARYVEVSIASLPGFYVGIALRQSLQALKRTRPVVITVIVANLVNIVLSALLIFGAAGMPRMGAVGAGIAASIVRGGMALILIALAWPDLGLRLRRWDREVFALRPLARTLAVGVPIGIQLGLEVGVFSVVGLLMGRLGTATVGGHQVAIGVASLTYMVPLGVSVAAAVLVGQAVGARDPVQARRAAAAALVAGAGFMLVSGLVLAAAPRVIASLYTNDPAVIAVAAKLLVLAAIFQLFDGVQVVAIGVLRGTGDTRVPMLVSLLGYWLLGLPVSLLLGFGLHGGAVGMWWGLVLGLGVLAPVLLVRVIRRLAGALERVRIEESGTALVG